MKGSGLVYRLVIILLLSSTVDAGISFGSSSDITSLRLEPGDYGVFQASFFNMGDELIDVDFEVEYPSDLRIEVDPPALSMDSSLTNRPDSSGSWLILDGGRRYVKTYPVDVYVKIPSAISRNTYRIKLIATAKTSEGYEGSGFEQSIVQVREIVFTVNTAGRMSRDDVETIRIDASSGDVIKEDAKKSFSSSQGTITQSQSAGGSSGSSSSGQTSSGGSEPIKAGNVPSKKVFDVSKDSEGNTNIDLPTGKVSLSQGQTETAVDLGLVTLLISIASLVVRIIK